MGKSKKRDQEKDPGERLEKLLKKVKKLNDEVELVREKVKANDVPAEKIEEKTDENLPPNQQRVAEFGEGTETEIAGSEGENDNVEFCDEMDSDGELEWKDMVGEDPSKSRALEMIIKEDLCDVWKAYCREGMKKDDEEALLDKYAVVKELQAPGLNPQVASQIGQIARARDSHMISIQKLAALSMSIIGSLMTTMHENRYTGMDIKDMLEPLKDAGNLLSLLMHKQSLNHRAFIEPGMSKEDQEIVKISKIEDWLFGNDLTEKIKDTKAHIKEGLDLFKIQQPSAPKSKPLNSRTPYKNRPRGGMGYSQQRGRQRQRFSFRGRQQFVNHRAQAPQQRPYGPPPPPAPRPPPRDK